MHTADTRPLLIAGVTECIQFVVKVYDEAEYTTFETRRPRTLLCQTYRLRDLIVGVVNLIIKSAFPSKIVEFRVDNLKLYQ